MIIASACLAGIKCWYDGKAKTNKKIVEMVKDGRAVVICPEQLGGLKTPREPSEIINGTGEDVLDSKVPVKSKSGLDVTGYFIKGAEEALRIARFVNAEEAILKEKSPSCGVKKIPGGNSGKLIDGCGVTAALLKRNGIKVISSDDL